MIFALLGTIGAIAGLVYTFLVWNFDYWKKRGVNGPKPKIFYGNLPSMVTQKRNISYELQEIYNRYREDNDFVGIYSIRTPQLVVLNPELTLKMYTTDFKNFHDNEASTWVDIKTDVAMSNNPFMLTGEAWKERRYEVTPGLTANRIQTVYPVTQEVCEDMVNYIKEQGRKTNGSGMNAKALCLRYTADLVTDCVLGVKAGSFTDSPTPVFEMTQKLFETTTVFNAYAFLAGLWPTIKSFYKARFIAKDVETFFFSLMSSAFKMRRNSSRSRHDFLDYILQLQDKKNYPDLDIMTHSMTFLLDGFETTSQAIAGCLYQLGKNPSKQAILYEEIMSNLNEDGRIDFEKLENLPYLNQCFYESMRIFPALTQTTKLCTAHCELTNKNGKKLKLKPNDVIQIPLYAYYHDEQYFPNPGEFQPERFSPENGGVKKFQNMGVFIPFGAGPRMCLGMRFALTQTKAAIAEITKNFNIKLDPRTRKDNLLDPKSFLGALEGGFWLRFEERN